MLDWIDALAPPTDVSGTIFVAYVLFDVALIIFLARLCGNLLAKIGQPRVVGEILAGVLLGPTLLGDTLSQIIAPLQVRPTLGAFGTLALIFFMFIAGAEFDIARVRGRVGQAGLLAVLCVAIPAALGFPVASIIFTENYVQAGTDFLPFALIIGSALSVTAFPVMAHILMERGELNTDLGSLAVATAGIVTVLMFVYIGFAAAVTAGGLGSFAINLVLIVLFFLVCWFVFRPLLARYLPPMFQESARAGTGVAIVFGGMVFCGLITHLLDIHAMIGGFVWGMILPDDVTLRKQLASKVRDITLVVLLPIFLALAGFSTNLRLLTLETFPAVLVMLVAAVAGKFISAVPARRFGLSWRETAVLGALVNTRGLLVLVVGLIGLELNIITTLTFTLFVLIALVTTLMTLPLIKYFTASDK